MSSLPFINLDNVDSDSAVNLVCIQVLVFCIFLESLGCRAPDKTRLQDDTAC